MGISSASGIASSESDQVTGLMPAYTTAITTSTVMTT